MQSINLTISRGILQRTLHKYLSWEPLHVRESFHLRELFHVWEPFHVREPFDVGESFHVKKPFHVRQPFHVWGTYICVPEYYSRPCAAKSQSCRVWM